VKEVITKSFWQGVKRSFQEALEEPPLADNALQTAAGETSLSEPPERNQRNYSLISITCTGTNDGTTVELNGTSLLGSFEIGSVRFRCGSAGKFRSKLL
jgi:hypothetical protein